MPPCKRPPEFLDNGTIRIFLTRGQDALVDVIDGDLAQMNWSAHHGKSDKTWYARGHIDRDRQHFMHRVIAARMGIPMSLQVDHINGNGTDNRRCNIRGATARQNGANRGLFVNNTSGFKGVSWEKTGRRWIAQLCMKQSNGKRRIAIGSFKTAEAAHEAYARVVMEIYGEFGRTK